MKHLILIAALLTATSAWADDQTAFTDAVMLEHARWRL